MAIYQHAMERGIITSAPNMLNAHYSAIWYHHDSFFALSSASCMSIQKGFFFFLEMPILLFLTDSFVVYCCVSSGMREKKNLMTFRK